MPIGAPTFLSAPFALLLKADKNVGAPIVSWKKLGALS
jgi:hypothetical protein